MDREVFSTAEVQIDLEEVIAAAKPCAMGVGCDEHGVCYAEAHGEPERCPQQDSNPTVDLAGMIG